MISLCEICQHLFYLLGLYDPARREHFVCKRCRGIPAAAKPEVRT